MQGQCLIEPNAVAGVITGNLRADASGFVVGGNNNNGGQRLLFAFIYFCIYKYNMNSTANSPFFITEIVRNYLKKEGIKLSYLTGTLISKPSRQNLYRILEKSKDMKTEMLMDFSVVLEYDFFAELSAQLHDKLLEKGVKAQKPERKVSESISEYSSDISYQSLLVENVQLNRELRALNQEIARLKNGSPTARDL